MKVRSRKQKGKRLQTEIESKFKEFLEKRGYDGLVKQAVSGESGNDIEFFGEAKDMLNLAVECKNVEKLNIWNAIFQAIKRKRDRDTEVVFFKKNRSKTYCVIPADYFFELLEFKFPKNEKK